MQLKIQKDVTFILVVAFMLRFVFAFIYHQPVDHLFSDMKNYVTMADQILADQWTYQHFFQPVGYSLFISKLKLVFARNWASVLTLLQILASTLTLYIFYVAIKNSMNEKIAKYSLLIGSIHTPWIALTGFALSETFFTFLLSVLLFLQVLILKKENKIIPSIIWGIIFILAFLLKGTHVFIAPLMFVLFFFYKKLDFFKQFFFPAMTTIAVGLILNGLYTKSKINKFQMSASAGGLNFVEGKCPVKWNQDSTGYTWLSPLYVQTQKNPTKKIWDHPFTDSSFFMQAGLKCIWKYPLVLVTSLEGVPFLFFGNYLWPVNQLTNWPLLRVLELSMSVFFIFGLVAVCGQFYKQEKEVKAETLFTYLVPILSCFLCVYIFKSEIRFRIPFDIFFIPVAVSGWDFFLQKIKN